MLFPYLLSRLKQDLAKEAMKALDGVGAVALKWVSRFDPDVLSNIYVSAFLLAGSMIIPFPTAEFF